MRKLLDTFISHLWPQPCLLCEQPSKTGLCGLCEHSLRRLDSYPWRCQQCCLPLASEAPLCGPCLRQPPPFSRSHIPFAYQHPLDFLIHQFKYRRHLASGHQLARLLIQHCESAERPDALVPVPLHWHKRWQRGFNQSELLAYPLARQLQVPLLPALRRVQPGHSQKGLTRRERLANLRQAFAVVPRFRPLLQGAHLVLVDDVVTTTATARCLSEQLLRAGADRVDIWALARTPES